MFAAPVGFATADGFCRAYEATRGFRNLMRRGVVLLARPVLRIRVDPGMTTTGRFDFSRRHPHVIIVLGEENVLLNFGLVEAGRKTDDLLGGILGQLRKTGRTPFVVFVNEVVISNSFDGADCAPGLIQDCAVVTLTRDGRQRIFDYQGPLARESAIGKAKELELEDGEASIVCESLWQASLPLENEDMVDIPVSDSDGAWVAMHTRTPGNSGAWCFRGENACEKAKEAARDLLFDRVDGCVSLRRVVDERISATKP